jgi:hypothetical protein
MYAEEIISMIDGPKLREQRRVILMMLGSGCDLDLLTEAEVEALEGLTQLLDEIADCCHDVYGKDCLFEDPELERIVNDDAEQDDFNRMIELQGGCHG